MANRIFPLVKACLLALALVLSFATALPASGGLRTVNGDRVTIDHGDTPTGLGGEMEHPNSPAPPSPPKVNQESTNNPRGGGIGPN